MKILIIYHDDADGMCCAAIVRRARPNSELVFYVMQYGDPVPLVDGYDAVYLLDFSLPENDMRRVAEGFHSFYLIYHHVTAIEQL